MSGYPLPVVFEANVGQVDARVKYLSRARDGVLFIASDEAVLAVSSPAPMPMRGARAPRKAQPHHSGVLTMRLMGANPDATVEGRGNTSARINYLVGRDPSRWHTNIPTVHEVVAHEAWPGIDVSYSADKNAGPDAIECTFTVRAGASLSAVRLAFDAPNALALTPDGDVETAIGIRQIRFTRPRVFEEGVEGRHEVSAKFVAARSAAGKRQLEVRFEVARRDRNARLIIDPSLIYSTYFGGSGQTDASTLLYGTGDSVNAIALDQNGDEYLTGSTTSQDFPALNDNFRNVCSNGFNCGGSAFITKLDGKTGAIIYSTLLGGSAGAHLGVGDEGNGIAVDQFGNAYVTGATSSESFPTTPGAFVTQCLGCQPVPFVTKLSPDGTSLVYSTLIERTGVEDYGNAIAIDESGNAYVTGTIGAGNALAVVLNPGGTALTYGVALASSTGYAVAINKKHQMWIGGQAQGNDFPSTGRAFKHRCKKCGSEHAGFVALLDPAKGQTRASLLYATFLGGDKSNDFIRGIAVDSKGRAWVVGSSNPTSLPGNQSNIHCGKGAKCGDHALLAVVDGSKSGGASLVLSEYFGGSGTDMADSIYLDGSGKAYIGGQTTSPNFPVTGNAVQSTYSPCTGCEKFRGPAFVAVVDPLSKKSDLIYSSYLGGATVMSPTSSPVNNGPPNLVEIDAVNGIAADSNGVIHAAGVTYASDFPSTTGAQQTMCRACTSLGSDGFIARINPSATTGAEALEYSSFIGGAGPKFFGDYAAGVAIDPAGAVYVGGLTTSMDFPVTAGAFQRSCPSCVSVSGQPFVNSDYGAFVAKLNPAAAPDTQLVYATYLDGSAAAQATGIAVDSAGETYTVGLADSADFPTTPNAYSKSCSGGACLFFSKLDASGSSLLYSSFLGGGLSANVAIDANGNALIGGDTSDSSFPISSGALQSNCKLCGFGFGTASGYFSKMDPNGSGAASLVYSTYLSGSGGKAGNGLTSGEAVYAIASDPNGNAILTGQATSPNFPTTANAYQTQCTTTSPQCFAGFVAVINPALMGSASLTYSTFLNGTMGNVVTTGYAVSSDQNGNLYVAGNTESTNFPVTPNSFQPACPSKTGCNSGFIVVLNRTAAPANQLVYGTYLGGTVYPGNDVVTALGLDSNGRIFVAGHTDSSDFPVTPDAAQPTCLACAARQITQGRDGFLTVLNPALSGTNELVYSTFLGGRAYDGATGLAIGPSGLVAVAGYSSSTDFPTTANAFESQCPACSNFPSNNGPFGFTNSPGFLNMDAFISVFQF